MGVGGRGNFFSRGKEVSPSPGRTAPYREQKRKISRPSAPFEGDEQDFRAAADPDGEAVPQARAAADFEVHLPHLVRAPDEAVVEGRDDAVEAQHHAAVGVP